MFARRLRIERIDAHGNAHLCPICWIDSFSMRNFTNDAIFDDTPRRRRLTRPVQASMTDWFRRKNYIGPGEQLRISEPGAVL